MGDELWRPVLPGFCIATCWCISAKRLNSEQSPFSSRVATAASSAWRATSTFTSTWTSCPRVLLKCPLSCEYCFFWQVLICIFANRVNSTASFLPSAVNSKAFSEAVKTSLDLTRQRFSVQKILPGCSSLRTGLATLEREDIVSVRFKRGCVQMQLNKAKWFYHRGFLEKVWKRFPASLRSLQAFKPTFCGGLES